MPKILLQILFLYFFAASAFAGLPDRVKVIRVFDGDTVLVKESGVTFKVRMAGIDAPEIGYDGSKSQPYSRKAKQLLSKLVLGQYIRITSYGRGGYNRLLAEIFCNRQNINLEMIRSGLAEVYRGKLPEKLDANAYTRAQSLAKTQNKGMWRQGESYQSPRQWRKQNRLN